MQPAGRFLRSLNACDRFGGGRTRSRVPWDAELEARRSRGELRDCDFRVQVHVLKIALSSLIPSSIGRWNALRPEIRPIPPARLLITAVRTASWKSSSPEAPPELISPQRPM